MSDSRPLKAPRRSPSVERRSLRALPLILLLVWWGRFCSGWRVSVTLLGCVASEGRQATAEQCYSLNARGIVRDGEASVPVLTASLGSRPYSAAAWCLQTQCILEKLFPVVFVHDCTIQHSPLYWGGWWWWWVVIASVVNLEFFWDCVTPPNEFLCFVLIKY